MIRKLFFIFFCLNLLNAQTLELLNKAKFAQGLFEDGLYETARKEFLELSRTTSIYSEEANFMQAECLYQMKNWPLALKEFERVFKTATDEKVKEKAFKRMGDTYYKMGKFLSARKTYIQYLKKYGAKEDVLFFLAQSLYNLKEFEEALKYFEELLKKFPETKYRNYAFYTAGQCLFSLQKFEKARRFFSSVYKSSFDDEAKFWEGVSLLKQGNYNEAQKKFEDVEKISPGSGISKEARLKIAEILILKKNYSQAEEIIKQFLGDRQKSAFANYLMGQIFYMKGNFAQAGIFYKKVFEKFPKTQWAQKSLFSLGWCYLNLKKYLKARKSFAELILKYPDSEFFPRAQFLIAHCYYFEGKFLDAAQSYEMLIKAFPKNVLVEEALYWQGISYLRAKKYERAEKSLKKFVEKFKNSKFSQKAILNLGIALEEQNKFKEAIKVYTSEDIQKLSGSGKDEILYALGQVCIKAGKFEKAVESFKKIKTEKLKPKAVLSTGHAYLNAKNFDLARKYYLKTSSEFPQTFEAEEAYFSIALSFYKEKKYTSALVNFLDFLEKYPESKKRGEAYYWAGWSAFAAKKWNKAISVWERYFNEYKDPQILLKIGDAYYNLKDYEKAKVSYQNFIEQFHNSPKIPQALYSLSLVLRKQNQLQKAKEYLTRLKEKHPESFLVPDAMFLLGEIYEEERNFAKAKEEFFEIFVKFPQNSISQNALYRAGLCAKKLEDFETERKIFETLIEKYPKSDYLEEAYFRICETYFLEKNYEKAVFLAVEFRKKFPSSSFAPFVLEIAKESLIQLGEKEKAEEIIKDLVQTYSSSMPAAKLFFEKGEKKFKEGKWQEAIDELLKVTKVLHNRKGALAQLMIAKAYFNMEEYTQARLEFLRVIYIYPEFNTLCAESQYYLGLIYKKKNNIKKAKQSFNKAIEKAPDSKWAKLAREELQKLEK